jgi:hypothetical protein
VSEYWKMRLRRQISGFFDFLRMNAEILGD